MRLSHGALGLVLHAVVLANSFGKSLSQQLQGQFNDINKRDNEKQSNNSDYVPPTLSKYYTYDAESLYNRNDYQNNNSPVFNSRSSYLDRLLDGNVTENSLKTSDITDTRDIPETAKENDFKFLKPIFPMFKTFNTELILRNISQKQGKNGMSNVPLYVKHRLQEEILAKPLQDEEEENHSITIDQIRSGILTELGFNSKPGSFHFLLNDSTPSQDSLKTSKTGRGGYTGVKNLQKRGYIQNGKFFDTSLTRNRNSSWFVYMNCSRDKCTWNNSTNTTNLLDEGWVLHNCSSVGCTEMYPKAESTRNFIRILLLVGSLCILKVFVFILVFYYCKNVRTGKYQGIRAFFSKEDSSKHRDSKGEMIVNEGEEEELLYEKHFESENGSQQQNNLTQDNILYHQDHSNGDDKTKRKHSYLSSEQKARAIFKKDMSAGDKPILEKDSKVWNPPNAMSPECQDTFVLSRLATSPFGDNENRYQRPMRFGNKCLCDELQMENPNLLNYTHCELHKNDLIISS